jgi:hypothetical protein
VRSREARGTSGRTTFAQAAITAIEPVVDLLLRIGITSPEAESLLRGLFVRQARTWLTGEGAGTPSDVRVALVTGVHRNVVAAILAKPLQIPKARERRRYPAGRLLRAWHTDPAYQDASGRPRDLPERGVAPSFAALVVEHLPGTSVGAALQELLRTGVIESLSHHRVRIHSRTGPHPGINLDNLIAYGVRARALLTALTSKLDDPEDRAYCDSTSVFEIPAARWPVIRNVIARRAGSLLLGLEQELQVEARRAQKGVRTAKLAVTVVETRELSSARSGRRREGSR